MEPIAHISYTFGLFLVFAAVYEISITPFIAILVIIGSELPDLIDWFFSLHNNFQKLHRQFTHTLFFLLVLGILAFYIPIIWFLLFGSFFHVLQDVIGGGSPIYPLSPLTKRGKILIIDGNSLETLGQHIKRILSPFFYDSEALPPIFGWYWLHTILSSIILISGALLYLLL